MHFEYNQEGCLPQGIHELSLDDIEEEFVVGKSQQRQEIFEKYKNHLNEIKDTNCCLNHWIDGSFVTLKENPNDIDIFTEFDGIKSKDLGIYNDIKHLIYDAPLRTENYCHSFCAFKVPKNYGKDYREYINVKTRMLVVLFPTDRRTKNLKGFIKLIGRY